MNVCFLGSVNMSCDASISLFWWKNNMSVEPLVGRYSVIMCKCFDPCNLMVVPDHRPHPLVSCSLCICLPIHLLLIIVAVSVVFRDYRNKK